MDEREGAKFFLDDPQKLKDPFPDLNISEKIGPFFYQPLNQWFVFATTMLSPCSPILG